MKTHIDDEYARAGVQDPKILLTTSRDPSSRLTQFVKELRLLLPNSQRINRGNVVVKVCAPLATSSAHTAGALHWPCASTPSAWLAGACRGCALQRFHGRGGRARAPRRAR